MVKKVTRPPGQISGWSSFTSHEKLAIKVIQLAVQDYMNGEEEGEYFSSEGFEFWCSFLQHPPLDPRSVRVELGLEAPDTLRVSGQTRLTKLLQGAGL